MHGGGGVACGRPQAGGGGARLLPRAWGQRLEFRLSPAAPCVCPPLRVQGFLQLAPKSAIAKLKGAVAEYSSPRPEPKPKGAAAGGAANGAASVVANSSVTFRPH